MNPILACHPAMRELRRILARLALMSHVGAAAFGRGTASSDEDIGGKRPPGGIDYKDDRQLDYRQKSAQHFVRRLQRCQNASQLETLVRDAEAALEAWQRTLIPEGQPPAPGDPQWKRWVAESPLDAGELARLFHVSRQYIHQVRKGYRESVRSSSKL